MNTRFLRAVVVIPLGLLLSCGGGARSGGAGRPDAPAVTETAATSEAPSPSPTPPPSQTSTASPDIPEIEMVSVEGGTFTMGCTPEQEDDCDDDERPAHSVTVSNFQIGKYEVTQRLWERYMGNNPSYFGGEDLPVENVRWNDVQEFIQKLNEKTGKKYRLPTEAEWEYAARGGANSKSFKYSGSNNIDDVAWYGNNSGDRTNPVGTKAANELGIYDMSGNVWEWVYDWYGDYTSDAKTNPTGRPSGSIRVFRGGNWIGDAWLSRVSFRYDDYPVNRYILLGFRLAVSP